MPNGFTRFPSLAIAEALEADGYGAPVILAATAPTSGQVLTATGAEAAGWATPAAVVSDHGALSGLGDDDHTQYWLRPSWHGKIYGAHDDCNPGTLLQMVQRGGNLAPTPTNITTSIARCSFFRPPADIQVNKLRFIAAGNTTGLYHVAIYRYFDLARMLIVDDFNTSTAATWNTAGSALAVTLSAGVLYFLAVSVDSTGATAGIVSWGSSLTSILGQISVAPGSWPGNLLPSSGWINGGSFDIAVTSGALPDPSPTPAAQSAWAGGMPAFWLDGSNA